MKLLVVYPEDDLSMTPDAYDVSTPAKRSRAFLQLFKDIYSCTTTFNDAEEYQKRIDELETEYDEIQAKLNTAQFRNDRVLKNALRRVRQELEEQENNQPYLTERDFEPRLLKQLLSFLKEAVSGNGDSAEKLLRQLAYWSGDRDAINSLAGYVWTIVTVKTCS